MYFIKIKCKSQYKKVKYFPKQKNLLTSPQKRLTKVLVYVILMNRNGQ